MESRREHTFYLIPGVKVGCTKNFKDRKRKYPERTVLIPIEVMICTDLEAEAREIYWQDQYNLPRDKRGYSQDNWSVNMTPEQRSEAGKKGGNSPLNGFNSGAAQRASAAGPNHPSKTGVLNRASVASPNHSSKTGKSGFATGAAQRASGAGPNHVTKQVFTCPHPGCGASGTGPTMKRWHFENCKMKPI